MSDWYVYAITWYVILLGLGVLFFPISNLLFKSFPDKGYGLSKAIGLLLVSYVVFILGRFHILPFTQFTVFLVITLFGLVAYRIHTRTTKNGTRSKETYNSVPIIIFEEALFALAFFAWAYIRGTSPEIRGLEKFMDFGFINAALRGDYFPPKDIWLAGKNINYYYFGHITAAVQTKLSGIPSYITYNLVLAQLFALGVLEAFSVSTGIVAGFVKKNEKLLMITGMLTTFIVNLGGNLHTIYAFTKGYLPEEPQPFWKVEAKYSFADISKYDGIGGYIKHFFDALPDYYWYPNATRFIPKTIHEFPLYSYVVADLHGHVFGIPFVLITISVLFLLFMSKTHNSIKKYGFKLDPMRLLYAAILGFLIGTHLMTNAFDMPIYMLLTGIIFLTLTGFTKELGAYIGVVLLSYVVVTMPFSSGFEPFASGLGFNCIPLGLTTAINSFIQGTFLEKRLVLEGNCVTSDWWMLVTLWGFFWFNGIFLLWYLIRKILHSKPEKDDRIHIFVAILFIYSTLLIFIPEFFYAKDIYPSHFRANTMFKLGYQAFIMMGIASGYTFALFKTYKWKTGLSRAYILLFIPLFGLIALYPNFAIDSYYKLDSKKSTLDGTLWISQQYEEYDEIIDYLNKNVVGQPTILEAQGDSYTDYNIVSSYTGIPTVAGWWVHEWLWRGDPQVVGKLIPDIEEIYTGTDIESTKRLLKKYNIQYVIIGKNEIEKYKNIQYSKFEALGKAIFRSSNQKGIIFQIPVDSI